MGEKYLALGCYETVGDHAHESGRPVKGPDPNERNLYDGGQRNTKKRGGSSKKREKEARSLRHVQPALTERVTSTQRSELGKKSPFKHKEKPKPEETVFVNPWPASDTAGGSK